MLKNNEKVRFTWVVLAAPEDEQRARAEKAPLVKLTYNRDSEDYKSRRSFGHLAYLVDDIYATCQRLQDGGVIINRPPRDGHMAFVRSPDGISIELLQKGDSLPPKEPWASMQNTGSRYAERLPASPSETPPPSPFASAPTGASPFIRFTPCLHLVYLIPPW